MRGSRRGHKGRCASAAAAPRRQRALVDRRRMRAARDAHRAACARTLQRRSRTMRGAGRVESSARGERCSGVRVCCRTSRTVPSRARRPRSRSASISRVGGDHRGPSDAQQAPPRDGLVDADRGARGTRGDVAAGARIHLGRRPTCFPRGAIALRGGEQAHEPGCDVEARHGVGEGSLPPDGGCTCPLCNGSFSELYSRVKRCENMGRARPSWAHESPRRELRLRCA